MKKKQSPYVKSNFPRVPGDFYPTVDTRCVDALLYHQIFRANDVVVDVCAPQGSSIVDYLVSREYQAYGGDDAFAEHVAAHWIVTNPPYTRPLVDQIIRRQIERVEKAELYGVACLLRTNFDHASSRADIFENCPRYMAQLKLRFRPWWSEDRENGAIHSFVWHIWTAATHRVHGVLYYTPPYDPKYASKPKKKKPEKKGRKKGK